MTSQKEFSSRRRYILTCLYIATMVALASQAVVSVNMSLNNGVVAILINPDNLDVFLSAVFAPKMPVSLPLAVWGADALLIYRCIILYRLISRRKRIALYALLGLAALASLGSGIVAYYLGATSHSRGFDQLVGEKSSQKNAPGIYATSYSKNNSADGFVTVAAQADGLHIVDVSALHPIVSHTLGPSTSFACPPVTLPSSSTTGSSTYAVISASSQLSSPEDAGRAVWMWNDDVKDAKQVKQSKTLFSKEIHGLYSCKALPQRIVAVSSVAEVSLVDAESLEVKAALPGNASSVFGAYIFSAHFAAFSSGDEGAVLVLCQAGKSKTTHLRILAIDEADSILQRHEWELPVDSKTIASISCSEAGAFSVLTALDGTITSFSLSSQEPRALSPLRLTGFSFIASSSKNHVSLLALTASHVLLAAVTSQPQEIVLLLWDLQFSVLLSSHTLSIPSALSASTLHVRLVAGTQTATKTQDSARGNVFLVLSSDAENKTTSVLLAVPCTVPTVSTIAAAMGKGGAGKKWLQSQNPSEGMTKQAGKVKQTPEEVARANLLSSVRTAVQGGRPQAATAAFMKWIPEGESKAAKQALDYNFVKSILNVILEPPAAGSASAATPEVTQYLLQKRVVSSAMISTPGGLLGALRARGDWKSVEVAFETVLDLTEAEMIECLRVVVGHYQKTLGSVAAAMTVTEDAMDVDVDQPPPASAPTKTTVPSLSAFLNLVASYPSSRGPLLVALRRYLKDAGEITCILEVLSVWLKQKANADEQLMPTNKDLKKSEQGVWIFVGRKANKKGGIPALQKILDFAQAILDASFITLLQHPPAHKVLRTLNTQLSPEIEFADAGESLRGSLEPFALAQQKAIKESLIPPQEREREKQSIDWRQRKKGPGAAPGVQPDIGVYKLEQLWL
ncbi:hypothetical protein D9619_000235 [Psilocybe cf. subviscida]|uniref:Uncharacterized protein n=1 Tax=Psilocybe cf. subviscida TaxID=2480587 RepID=A0A8H5BGW9_9AGAR|nr:hypothetical protein D9619_000235 [Psilocybe cf. subviscida]